MICFVNWKTPKKRTDGFFWTRILITAQIVIFSARDLVALFQETRLKAFDPFCLLTENRFAALNRDLIIYRKTAKIVFNHTRKHRKES